MATETYVEKINVAALMESEGALEVQEKLEALLDADPEASALVESASSVEDVYQIIKRFIDVTLEQVKIAFQKSVDYFRESKTELADEALDNVVGGWSLSSWWGKYKKAVIMVAEVALAAAVGLAIGAVTFGAGGAVAGFCMGAIVGTISVKDNT